MALTYILSRKPANLYIQDDEDPYLRIVAPEVAVPKGRPRNQSGSSRDEPVLPPNMVSKSSSKTGLPASGRRQYSRWEKGPDLEVLDARERSQLGEVLPDLPAIGTTSVRDVELR